MIEHNYKSFIVYIIELLLPIVDKLEEYYTLTFRQGAMPHPVGVTEARSVTDQLIAGPAVVADGVPVP